MLVYRWTMSVGTKTWRMLSAHSTARGNVGLSKRTLERAQRTKRVNLVLALWCLVGLGSVLPFLLRHHLPLGGFMFAGLIERFPAVLFAESIFWLALSVTQLASHLPEPARVVVLERLVVPVVRVLPRDSILRWCWALPWIAPRLPERLLPEAFVQSLPSRRALGALAPYLSEPLLEQALHVLEQTSDRWLRLDLLRALIPHLAAPLVRRSIAMVEEFQTISSDVEVMSHRIVESEVQSRDGWGSAKETLAQIATRLAELGHVREALTLVLPHSDSDWGGRALARLAPYLTALSPNDLHTIWREMLYAISVRLRKDLLANLCALRPVIVALAGQPAVTAVFLAIQDVGRWWP